MSDGHFGKCKGCAKLDARANYAAKRKQYASHRAEHGQVTV